MQTVIRNLILSILVIVGLLPQAALATSPNPLPTPSGIPNGTQLFVWQGYIEHLGNTLAPGNINNVPPTAAIEEQAWLLSRNDVIVVSHGFDVISSVSAGATSDGFINPHNCSDVRYQWLPDVLARAKQLNTSLKIFLYVPATADRPCAGCAYPTHWGGTPQECPGWTCSNFSRWIEKWHRLSNGLDDQNQPTGRPSFAFDGFFLDYFSSNSITPIARDGILALIKRNPTLPPASRNVMVNLLTPNGEPDYVNFATSAVYRVNNVPQVLPNGQPDYLIGQGDYLFMEGFHYAKGNLQFSGADFSGTPAKTVTATQQFMHERTRGYTVTNPADERGFNLAAQATLPSFQTLARSGLTTFNPCTNLSLSIPMSVTGFTGSQPLFVRPNDAWNSFLSAWRPGNVFQITYSDLGTEGAYSPANGSLLLNLPKLCNNTAFP